MMRGGCSVTSSENHYSVMNGIMFRFRPIAPKPAGGEDEFPAAEQERRNCAVQNGRRAKRKYVRVRGPQRNKRKTRENGRLSPPEKSGIEDVSSPEKGSVTLQLFPERWEKDKGCCNNNSAACINFQETDQHGADGEVNYGACSGGTAAWGNVRSVIKTWIIVECVTETYIDSGVGLGISDGEKLRNLQADTFPGFVSDGRNDVVWVNEAYRKMVSGGENGVSVWLVVKEKLPNFSPSFACRVRMIQLTKRGHKWNRIVACDVWRMGFAGFAWKLDVETALGLGS